MIGVQRRGVRGLLWNKQEYPWDRWFSQEHLTLRCGRDFLVAPRSMAQQLRNAAQARGRRISIQVMPTELWVKNYKGA